MEKWKKILSPFIFLMEILEKNTRMEKEIIKAIPRLLISIILVVLMWAGYRWALYVLVTLSLIGTELLTLSFNIISKKITL